MILIGIITVFANYSWATSYNVGINMLTFNPALTNAMVGDTVNFSTTANHPIVQVSSADWVTGTPTPMGGGWGEKTANFTIVIGSTDTIFFMCKFHGPGGMKGQIVVGSVNNIRSGSISKLVIPNPVKNGLVQISRVSNQREFRLYAPSGELLHTAIPNSDYIEIELLRTGWYLLQIFHETGEAEVRKLFVE